MGLTREISRTLVVETMLGSAKLLAETGQDPEALRAVVTSPAGTTAAACARWNRERCARPSWKPWPPPPSVHAHSVAKGVAPLFLGTDWTYHQRRGWHCGKDARRESSADSIHDGQ